MYKRQIVAKTLGVNGATKPKIPLESQAHIYERFTQKYPGALIAFDHEWGEECGFYLQHATEAARMLDKHPSNGVLHGHRGPVPYLRCTWDEMRLFKRRLDIEGRRVIILSNRNHWSHRIWSEDIPWFDYGVMTLASKRFLSAVSKDLCSDRPIEHWPDWLFPHVYTPVSEHDRIGYYDFHDVEEARAFLDHSVLRRHLLMGTQALLNRKQMQVSDLFVSYRIGHKVVHNSSAMNCLWASMTLFDHCWRTSSWRVEKNLFCEVLEKYFGGKPDEITVAKLMTDPFW